MKSYWSFSLIAVYIASQLCHNTTMSKDLFSTDWNAELQPGDTAVRRESGEELQVVFLAALQRMARMGGIVRQDLKILTPSDSIVQAIFTSVFKRDDGSEVQFVGSADCSARNTSGRFIDYPTAVAESRAEARCLRKALGIKMLSSEEVGLRENLGTLEASPSAKADSQILAAIEKLCETRNIPVIQVIEEVTDKQRSSTIFELSQLTTIEAQKALAWLNEQNPAKKPAPSTVDKRAARKAELTNKLKEDNEGTV